MDLIFLFMNVGKNMKTEKGLSVGRKLIGK
jgi:hypothetical protein